VTNGQIPHWLDLENPRVTVVTHEVCMMISDQCYSGSSSRISVTVLYNFVIFDTPECNVHVSFLGKLYISCDLMNGACNLSVI
jgi:hypothetical protein